MSKKLYSQRFDHIVLNEDYIRHLKYQSNKSTEDKETIERYEAQKRKQEQIAKDKVDNYWRHYESNIIG